MFADYNQKTGIQVNYQSIGSGGGILQLTNKTVDFGASDGPLNDEQATKFGVPVLHITQASGAVVVTYNLPGDNNNLNLTPDIIADIFLGKIKTWNDPRIASINKGVTVPAFPILVAHRSDGSGTTNIFTNYLSKVSPEWKTKVGSGGAVNWPSGLGGKGNEGVAGLVKQTPGAIGYVELIYALQNKMDYAKVQNKKGKFIVPSIASVTAAGNVKLPGSNCQADDLPGGCAWGRLTRKPQSGPASVSLFARGTANEPSPTFVASRPSPLGPQPVWPEALRFPP